MLSKIIFYFKKNALLLIPMLFAMIPGFIFSFKSIQEPWTLFRMARITASMPTGHIADYVNASSSYRTEHLGGELFLSAFYIISKMPAEWIVLLPIGTFLLTILYYFLGQIISDSSVIAIALSIYAGWYYPRLISQYGVQTYAWTNTLFLGFLIVYLCWLQNRKPVCSILMMIIFSVTFLFYQTTPIWIIGMILVALVLKAIVAWGKIHNSKPSWSILGFMVVFYFTFDTVFYGNFLKRFASESIGEFLFSSISTKVLIPIFGSSGIPQSPFEVAPQSPRIATLTTLISLLIMIIPVVVWCLVKIIKWIREKELSVPLTSHMDIFIWSIIVISVIHVVGYAAYGAVSIRFIPLSFPLLLIAIPENLGWSRKISVILSVILALVSIVGFLSYTTSLKPDPKPTDFGIASQLLPDKSRIVSDANVFGSLQLFATGENKIFEFVWPDSEIYSSLVGSGELNKNIADYYVIDKSGKPLISKGWIYLAPWSNYIVDINRNPNLSIIYESNELTIFQPRNKDLPYFVPSSNVKDANKSILAQYIRLIYTIILLLVFPGFGITYFLQILLNFENTYLYSVLIFVLSICVVVIWGYIVNFTSIGLEKLPLTIGLSSGIMIVVSLVISIKTRRSITIPHGVTIMVSLILLILIWSFGSLYTAQLRANTSKGYTEFFLGNGDTGLNEPNVYVANRQSCPSTYKILILKNGVLSTAIGPFEVASESVTEFELPIHTSKDDDILLHLIENGKPISTLELRRQRTSITAMDLVHSSGEPKWERSICASLNCLKAGFPRPVDSYR